MKKTAAQLDAEIAAFVASADREITLAMRDLDANRRSVLAAAQSCARTYERIRGIVDRKREALERELDRMDPLDPRRQDLERAISRLEDASVPDGADVVQGVRDVLDDAKVRIG